MKAKGTYVLILYLKEQKIIRVGRLGRLSFPVGYYAYVGSAFGPAGLKGRLMRYLHPPEKPHWHIDYLRKEADLEEIWLSEQEDRREHSWASTLESWSSATVPVPGFGCSDCKCYTHLFHFRKRPSYRAFNKQNRLAFPRDQEIQKLGSLESREAI